MNWLRLEKWLCYATLAAVFFALGWQIRANGFVSPAGVHRWAEAAKLVDSPEGVTQTITKSFPYVPTVFLLFIRLVTGSLPPWTALLANALVAAALGSVLFNRMRDSGMNIWTRIPALLLLCAHPLFLWPATSGDFQAMLLLIFAFLCRALMHVAEDGDARSLMAVAAICPLLLFCDGRGVYLLVALVPLVPLLLPTHVTRNGATGGFIILLLPLFIALVSCFYVGWATAGEPAILFRTAFARMGTAELADSQWQLYGPDSVMVRCALLLLGGVVSFPPILLAMVKGSGRWRAAFVASFLPLLAALLAMLDGTLPHPCSMLFLAFAPWALLWIESRKAGFGVARMAALVVCVPASWIVFSYLPSAEMQGWASALQGRSVKVLNEADAALGQWLASHDGEVLADDRLLDMPLAARGHARQMHFPDSTQYRVDIKGGMSAAKYVVLAGLDQPLAATDRLRLRLRGRTEKELTGYRLVYDSGRWEVYERLALVTAQR